MEYHLSLSDIDVLALDVSTCEYHLNHTSAIVLANHFPKAYLLPFHYGTYDCPTVAAHCGEPEDIYPYITNSLQRGLILAPGEPLLFLSNTALKVLLKCWAHFFKNLLLKK